jgi:hypothetical protein
VIKPKFFVKANADSLSHARRSKTTSNLRATRDLVKHDDSPTSRCKRDTLDHPQCKFILARSKLHQQGIGTMPGGLCEGIGLAKFVGVQRPIPPNPRRHFARLVEKIAPFFYIACVIEGAAPQSE